MRLLDDWVFGYSDYMDNQEPSEHFIQWVAISCIASALQRKCWLKTGKTQIRYPNMYILLVGPVGGRKGTALTPGLDIVRDLMLPMTADIVTREQLIKSVVEAQKTDLDTNGVMTVHSSMTAVSPEFANFLDADDKKFTRMLCDWFDCAKSWKYETKTQGKFAIQNLWINILGATTPMALQNILNRESIGGGFSSRIVYVYAGGIKKVCPDPYLDPDLREKLAHDLAEIAKMWGEFSMTSDAFTKYCAWYEHQRNNPRFADPALLGYNERRQDHMLKVSMILSASQSDNKLVDVDTLQRAIDMLELAEERMPYAIGLIGENQNLETMSKILMVIEIAGTIQRAQLMRKFVKQVHSDEFDKILRTLEMAECIKTVYNPIDGTTAIKFLKHYDSQEVKKDVEI